jgi:hypothetical protein
MARISLMKVILPIGIGFGLNAMSHNVGLRGDLAASLGNRGAALSNHVSALLLTIAAFACFGYAGWQIWQRRKRRDEPADGLPIIPSLVKAPRADADGEAFDPDAVLARYLAKKQAAELSGPPEPPPLPPSPSEPARPVFGRKQR